MARRHATQPGRPTPETCLAEVTSVDHAKSHPRGSVLRLRCTSALLDTTPEVQRPAPADLRIEDWNLLFGAVLDRLRRTVTPLASQSGTTCSPALASAAVLECVAALEQLHAQLAIERAPVALTRSRRAVPESP